MDPHWKHCWSLAVVRIVTDNAGQRGGMGFVIASLAASDLNVEIYVTSGTGRSTF